MESDELRQRELGYLKERENECVQLLGQANIMLEKIAAREGLDFEGYESSVTEANAWYQYQQVLLKVVAELSELTYTLNMGAISRENSYAMLTPYAQQADGSLNKLRAWHGENEKTLEIDTSTSKRRRQGLDKAFWVIPALVSSDLGYREVSESTTQMIKGQKSLNSTVSDSGRDLYREDITLVKLDGDVYYLPPAEGEEAS